MKKLILLTALGALGLSYAQAQTPVQKTKTLVIEYTETWCYACGGSGIPGADETIKSLNNSSSGYLFTVRGSSTPSSLNTVGVNDFKSNYVSGSVPQFFVKSTPGIGAYTTPSYTASQIMNHVTPIVSGPTVVSAAANFKYTGTKLEVGAKAKFWEATSGEYYMTVFVVEDKLPATQTMGDHSQKAVVLHPNLRGAMSTTSTTLAPSPWGVQIATGSIAINTTVSKLYTINLDPTWVKANLKYYVAIYKKENGKYEIVNIEEAKVGLLDVQNIAGLEEATLYPNPVTAGDAQLNISVKQAATMDIQVTDLNGRVVYTSNNIQFNSGSNKVTIPTQNLANGTYTVNLIADGKANHAQQLVIAK